MLRVLTLSTLFPDASRPVFGPFVEAQTLGLASHPDAEVQVVVPRGIPPFGGFHPRYRDLAALPKREEWKDVTVHRPRFIHIPGGRFDPALMTRALLPKLRAIRETFAFDVIDAEFFFPDGPAAVALGRALGVPVSIKARGGDIHLWGERAATRRQIVDAGCAADGMLAVSTALRDDMIAMGMPGDRIAVHYTGIDHERFAPGRRAQMRDALGIAQPLIVSIGALIERKGHALVIEALRDLPRVRLVIIGKGPERARFEALARRLGVADRVRFTGAIPHDDTARWLSAADAMVLASVSEGLANAWVEALACGTPIVISDVGGARELLDRPEAGRIVQRTAPAIAAGLRAVLDEAPEAHAVATTVDRFSWETNTAQLYDHLRGLTS